MKQIDRMLADARANRSWAEITIIIKDGKPALIRQTIQHKVEDCPANEHDPN
ncbi:MAG TPA: hypothetical protein VGR55_00555 [Candidatus Acidoferrum sp.]|nr:hypothetical protein [Candidatus Acidoferrum sp.]